MNAVIAYLKETARNTTPKHLTTSGGTGNIVAGYRSITITSTEAGGGADVTITFSDSSTYVLKPGQVYTESTKGILPAYTIAGGSHKWYGTKA